ncbi:hypothetical protein GFL39_26410 [Rhizobium leguminosarum bv. viciae]|uniref:hypothetical protein n=1 Tax=Rhizobium leguminosarum TaxID=384 RepID=UPI001441C43E|nr:hypothetical protein [Rhizobium leguminosarum]NKL08406.1 hypothetical protein [Rhizobium leguminosarum bv. viciae]
MIRKPRQITPYADRDLDCQAALEDAFQQMVRLAITSGWDKIEAITALQELAFAHLSTEDDNMRITLAILQAGLTKH